MLIKSQMDKELADAISDVILELATELDLHYEDEDFFALGTTLGRMQTLANLIVRSGYPTPEAYEHILRRYHWHHQ